ncbi:MAG: hypothetical protein Fur0022_09830 [Anaerolineales bacterium]
MTENNEIEPIITPIESIHANVDKFIEAAGVDKVYGNAVEKDKTVVIPAAEVITSMGFGMGGSAKGEGGGGGGGFSTSRPVAVVIVTEQGVRVEPIVDVTKVALAMFTAVGFMLSTLAKMKKGR